MRMRSVYTLSEARQAFGFSDRKMRAQAERLATAGLAWRPDPLWQSMWFLDAAWVHANVPDPSRLPPPSLESLPDPATPGGDAAPADLVVLARELEAARAELDTARRETDSAQLLLDLKAHDALQAELGSLRARVDDLTRQLSEVRAERDRLSQAYAQSLHLQAQALQVHAALVAPGASTPSA
jgi:hypothetical protein